MKRKRKLKSTGQTHSKSLLQKPKRKKFQKSRRDDPRKHKSEEKNQREYKIYKKK